MLQGDVNDLAVGAFRARELRKTQALHEDLDRAQSQIAVAGAAGHGGVLVIGRLGVDHMRECGAIAIEELKRACVSCGRVPKRADLEAAWDNMMKPALENTASVVIDQLRPHIPNAQVAQGNVRASLSQASAQSRSLALADFAYFVAEKRRDRRERLWGDARWLGASLIGGFIARAPDVAQWLLGFVRH